MAHLARTTPYESTKIAPETTKAEIDSMLHEFIILDDEKKRVCEVKGIRWTELPPSLPMLEFMVEYVYEGVRKQSAIRIKPPLLARKVRKPGYGQVIMPQPAQSMRLLYWYLKTKLESVLFGLTDVTQEFLSEVLVSLPDGSFKTVGETIMPQIKESKIPMLEA